MLDAPDAAVGVGRWGGRPGRELLGHGADMGPFALAGAGGGVGGGALRGEEEVAGEERGDDEVAGGGEGGEVGLGS